MSSLPSWSNDRYGRIFLKLGKNSLSSIFWTRDQVSNSCPWIMALLPANLQFLSDIQINYESGNYRNPHDLSEAFGILWESLRKSIMQAVPKEMEKLAILAMITELQGKCSKYLQQAMMTDSEFQKFRIEKAKGNFLKTIEDYSGDVGQISSNVIGSITDDHGFPRKVNPNL